jgi:hypothetical protein
MPTLTARFAMRVSEVWRHPLSFASVMRLAGGTVIFAVVAAYPACVSSTPRAGVKRQ